MENKIGCSLCGEGDEWGYIGHKFVLCRVCKHFVEFVGKKILYKEITNSLPSIRDSYYTTNEIKEFLEYISEHPSLLFFRNNLPEEDFSRFVKPLIRKVFS